jgi:hypothetical protein
MDDLELLKRLPSPIEPLDIETKDRMRAGIGMQAAARRTRRGGRIGVLAIAAALAVAGLAAGLAVHPWSADDPVTLEGISDPTGEISTPAALESVIAEFAPAIRLPDDGSYDVWIRRHETPPFSDIGQGLTRADVVHSMMFVSQCQWGQRWLDASATGDQVGTGRAVQVLGGIAHWFRANDPMDDFGTAALLDDMRRDDRVGVQSFENGCGYTGAWGTTPALQDATAMGRLAPAVTAARRYLQDGGAPPEFEPSVAGSLDPSITWTWSHEQPAPASPGFVFIGPSAERGVVLVSVSEAGTQFCAAVTDTGVQRGVTTDDLSTIESADGSTVDASVPGPVTCTPGGW